MVYQIIFWITATLCFIYWVFQLILLIRAIKAVPVLDKLKTVELENWPKVSVIIPARNEAKTMKQAIETRLLDDYPNLELILVDDRSTDNTAEIVDEFARRDARVKILHIKTLPSDWLGKIYAMDQGVKIATGEWLLFSDADIYIKRGTLKKTIVYCEKRNLDHLAVFPDMYPVNFLLDIIGTFFIRVIAIAARVWEVADPDSDAAFGAGAYNLVRKSALEKSKGFDWIKLDQGDDAALGKVLKQAGAKQSLVNGRGYVGVYFYKSLGDIMRGAERPTFTTIGNFSFWRLFFYGLMILLLELSPLLLLFFLGISFRFYPSIILIIISISVSILVNLWFKRPIWTSFFVPIGVILSTIGMWRAGILDKLRGGVYWRGTFYPTEVLRQGRRYKF